MAAWPDQRRRAADKTAVFSFLALLNLPPHLPFLIGLRVVTGLSADGDTRASLVNEVPMAAFATAVHKPGLFQVRNQLSHFARHLSIKIVLHDFAGVNLAKNSRRRRCLSWYHRGRETLGKPRYACAHTLHNP
jgi:hypothetical protein